MEFVNANIYGGNGTAHDFYQEIYVPALISDTGNKEIISPVVIHDDQCLEEWARNVQWTYRVGRTSLI